MKLESITLHNFRQFTGTQRLRFADTSHESVTLLFGANGSGKTTLLNAFTWCLYGTLSQDVEGKERLITDHVWDEASFGQEVEAYVELEFEHNGSAFRAKREVSGVKSANNQDLGSPRMRLWETDASGQNKEIIAASQRIDAILPEPLSRFFFFNGERIESLVSRGAYAEIKQAVKSLLGLEQVERAILHLPKVQTKLQNELRKYGGEKLAGLSTQIEETTDRIAALDRSLELNVAEHASLGAERDAVRTELAKHRDAGPLQQERERVESELASQREALKRLRLERATRVAQDGPIAFISGLAAETNHLADQLSERGELPTPIKRDFVEALLMGNVCLCGSDLGPGTPARNNVENWKLKAGLGDAEAAWQRLRGSIALLDDSRRKLRGDLEALTQGISQTTLDIRDLESHLTAVEAELRDVPLTDVQRLTDKEADLNVRIDDVSRSIGADRNKKETEVATLDSLRLALKGAEVKDQMAGRVRARVALVEEVQSALAKILAIRTETVRQELDEKIRAVFRRITVKPFEPTLSEDFELNLVRTTGSTDMAVSKSTGENQILSLSFVAAVSELAAEYRKRNNERRGILDEGGRFPIVMDAAFGSLDRNYQRDVSEALSRLAPQMVVLVSKSQGLGTVMEQLGPHIGVLGVIEAHSTNPHASDEDVELNGRSFPYIRTKAENDFARIEVA